VRGERRGVVVDGAGGDAEAKAPVQETSAAGWSAGSRRWRRGAGMRGLLPHPHPTVGGEAGVLRAAACNGGEAPRVAPPVLNPTGFGLFFNTIESNPKLYKQVDIHIQPSPNPLKSMGQNPIGFGSSPIHSQE